MKNDDTLSLENLRTYFCYIRKNPDTLEDYVQKIKKYSEKFFYAKEDICIDSEVKSIAIEIYHNVRSHVGTLLNKGDNFIAMKLLQKLELDITLMCNKKYIKKLDELEYRLMLTYMLYLNNNDYEAYNKCSISTSEYFTAKKLLNERIGNEEEKIRKSHTDKAMLFNYLICFSKFAQIICHKTGLKDEISMSYWNEKYFTEKLCFLNENLSPVFQMITAKNWVWEGDIIQTIIIDDHYTNRYYKFKSKTMIFLKAIKLLFLRIVSGYGEKPIRLLITSIAISCLFAFVFSVIDNNLEEYFDYCYNSILIFFSFGILENNLIEQNALNKVIITIEIILGVFFVNGYIVALTRKMFR